MLVVSDKSTNRTALYSKYRRSFVYSYGKMSERAIPRLLLFDIDATLTRSNHKNGIVHPMCEALSIIFGREIRKNDVRFAGSTDPLIIRDVLAANNVTKENTDNYDEKVNETYRILPEVLSKGIAEGRLKWEALPNVHEILTKLSQTDEVRLALLTGNLEPNARIKLTSASVDVSLFETDNGTNGKRFLGAFGSDRAVRSELVGVAQKRYSEYLGNPVKKEDMVVIGDSPKDIACAHANQVACVAVTTGIDTAEDLKEAEYILEGGFVDLDESVKAVIQTQYQTRS